MNSLPRIGQIVPVRVSAVNSAGLFVQVIGSDARGIIRLREIVPPGSEHLDDWKQQHPLNSELQGLVIDRREDGRLELSLRQVKRDPWRTVAGTLVPGQLIEGVVANVEKYGAFVELTPGVSGLIHSSRLPPWISGAMADLFWPGDRVKVIVDSVDAADRRIGLTLFGLTERRWRQAGDAAAQPVAQPAGLPADPDAVKLPLELLMQRPPQRILVVEDDPEHRDHLVNWLRRAGQNAQAAGSGEEALATAAEFLPEMALVDLGLPDMLGAELLRRLLERQPELHAIMMTADFNHEADTRDLEGRGYRLFLKPLRARELYDVLLDQGAGLKTQARAEALPVVTQPDAAFAMTADGPEIIVKILHSLIHQTRAQKAIVFALDPVQRKVEILAQAGRTPLDRQALPGLIRSPVRDVAEDGLTVRTDDAALDEGRYRYLIPLLPFASCIGLPVTANLPTRAALFVFHTQRQAFDGSDRELAAAAAYAIASVLERQMFVQQSSDLHRLALLGQLSRALVHEVNHRLSPVDFALDNLQAEFRELGRMIEKLPEADSREFGAAERSFADADQSLGRLAQAIRALIDTARLFGRMARSDHEAGVLVLSEMAGEVCGLLRNTADKQHVKLLLAPPDHLIATRTQITLVRQVLINVVLNAIQQIGSYRPKEGGQVRIAVGERWEGDRHLVYFLVEDDGPGIHRRLWQQIFQLGYTTRKDGSGLGLHISRSLIESLGGRIDVQDSHLYWGTSFVVELPLRS